MKAPKSSHLVSPSNHLTAPGRGWSQCCLWQRLLSRARAAGGCFLDGDKKGGTSSTSGSHRKLHVILQSYNVIHGILLISKNYGWREHWTRNMRNHVVSLYFLQCSCKTNPKVFVHPFVGTVKIHHERPGFVLGLYSFGQQQRHWKNRNVIHGFLRWLVSFLCSKIRHNSLRGLERWFIPRIVSGWTNPAYKWDKWG